jgi:hypothetical protein
MPAMDAGMDLFRRLYPDGFDRLHC